MEVSVVIFPILWYCDVYIPETDCQVLLPLFSAISYIGSIPIEIDNEDAGAAKVCAVNVSINTP